MWHDTSEERTRIRIQPTPMDAFNRHKSSQASIDTIQMNVVQHILHQLIYFIFNLIKYKVFHIIILIIVIFIDYYCVI